MENPKENPFISRGGLKLQHAIEEFNFSVNNLICADFGCSVGGFTDCLLQNGAAHIHAIDTAYGILDYRLRIDSRVTVMERTNLLHTQPPPDIIFNLITVDAGWTPQKRIIPIALKWLNNHGHIITLIKPHYELNNLSPEEQSSLTDYDQTDAKYILNDNLAAEVCTLTINQLKNMHHIEVLNLTKSPIRGGGKRGGKHGKRKGAGNVEYLALLHATP